MIKVGDKVAPFFNMGQTGIVTELKYSKAKQWTGGGSLGPSVTVVILVDKTQESIELKLDELMRLE